MRPIIYFVLADDRETGWMAQKPKIPVWMDSNCYKIAIEKSNKIDLLSKKYYLHRLLRCIWQQVLCDV